MNSVNLIGRLAQAPEVRYTKNGKAVASFTIAVSRVVYPGQAQAEATDFIPVVVWGALAEACGNQLTKGQRVFVEGRMQVRSYEAADGQKRRVSEVVAGFVARSVEAERELSDSSSASSTNPVDFSQFGRDVGNEKIPF
jgi:single-strand DNA-binding protein